LTYEISEHAADVGFRAHSLSLPELFAHAARALVAIAMDTADIEPLASYLLGAQSEARIGAGELVEVLYFLDGRKLAMRSFHVRELTADRVSVSAIGEPRDLIPPTPNS
jgi:SHS2 domain-containing protein